MNAYVRYRRTSGQADWGYIIPNVASLKVDGDIVTAIRLAGAGLEVAVAAVQVVNGDPLVMLGDSPPEKQDLIQ